MINRFDRKQSLHMARGTKSDNKGFKANQNDELNNRITDSELWASLGSHSHDIIIRSPCEWRVGWADQVPEHLNWTIVHLILLVQFKAIETEFELSSSFSLLWFLHETVIGNGVRARFFDVFCVFEHFETIRGNLELFFLRIDKRPQLIMQIDGGEHRVFSRSSQAHQRMDDFIHGLTGPLLPVHKNRTTHSFFIT